MAQSGPATGARGEAAAQGGPETAAPGGGQAAAGALHPYVVRAGEAEVMVAADEAEQLAGQARQERADALAAALYGLQAEGLAGDFAYDEALGGFRAELSDAAVERLNRDARVAAVEPAAGDAAALSPLSTVQQSGVSSVIFAQINTPFVWGNTSMGGLGVQLALLDNAGHLVGVPAVPTQPLSACTAAEHCVKVDRSLYFETMFVAPDNPGQYVAIRASDEISVTTSGDDPATPGLDPPQNKLVPIVDLSACSSPMQDSVQGDTLFGGQVVVTFGSALAVPGNYLTPGNGMTYAEVTADPEGHFSAATFRTSSDPTYKKVDINQGKRGFARVRVPDLNGHLAGDEVYTVYGQNAYILENSTVMHGYAFSLPGAPSGLDPGVAAPRPATSVALTLRDAQGALKDTQTAVPGAPYRVTFAKMIEGGDSVEIAISHGSLWASLNEVRTVKVTAGVDLAAKQIVGGGPASTAMVVTAGNVQGYVTRSTNFNAFATQVASDASGRYAAGAIQCGAGSN
ncbi:MAG TPA: hypothetical protein VF832_20045, partial [Longimicrobiales bacterium]